MVFALRYALRKNPTTKNCVRDQCRTDISHETPYRHNFPNIVRLPVFVDASANWLEAVSKLLGDCPLLRSLRSKWGLSPSPRAVLKLLCFVENKWLIFCSG
jgi:hypothetical protein